jgi:hypothetical protein
MNRPPSLEQLRAARDSARARRNHTARRLKRVILKIITRIEAYEHELSLLTKVERDLIANGTTAELFPRRAETRFDASPPVSAVTTLAADSDAPEAPREAPRNEISGLAWDDPATAEMIAHHYASGDGF